MGYRLGIGKSQSDPGHGVRYVNSLRKIPDVIYTKKTLCYASAFVSEEDEEDYQDNDNQKAEHASIVKDLTDRLEGLQTCSDLINKRGTALQRALNELETLDVSTNVSPKIKAVNERAALFRIASNTMINVWEFE